ncbi:hypothetical protein ACFQPC_12185 [Herminiimonas glaciei]|uniref:Uncharacterized protein n=1 Tax=Herminiimonas glaciei TaxID=523788 RepID=A0ABW2ICJ1_9BURK|nr:hypothetical protein [Janthinobacterium sp. Marseille]
MPRRIIASIASPFRLIRNSAYSLWAIQSRERVRLWDEMTQMRGLLPLLMKQRNGYRWTELDRKRIKVHLHKLVELSPYMVLFVAPGGFIVLPVLAWWLDRRRLKHDEETAARISKELQQP